MDRDATAAAEVVPPIEWATVQKTAGIGFGLCALAAILGATGISELNTIRLFAVFFGAVIGGLAVSARSDLWQTWLLGAAIAGAAIMGTPAHWDSFRLLFWVLAGVALIRAGMVAVPTEWRKAFVSVLILLHFVGILMATTSPYPTPWMVDQLYRRAYEPYLQFVYLRNAYHFYSPEPGPASLIVCLLKTDEGEEIGADGQKRRKYRMEWLVTPRRPADVRDPLGVTYFRRLSITDQIARTGSQNVWNVDTFENANIRTRRITNPQQIPMHPNESDYLEYKIPDQLAVRYLLPSYAQHILMDLPESDRGRTTVKIYRLEHRTLDVGRFIGISNYDRKPGDPYYPTEYYPYFLGEFGFVKDPNDANKVKIDLLDPQEPLLYWLIPVIARPGGVPGDPKQKDYIDYLSVHAGREFDWSLLR